MAYHGRRGLGRLMMGSVTAEVLAHSPVPVLVVR
jgi:nucleotide-binding universal stress UspA family protein